jgi:hypothetical protein
MAQPWSQRERRLLAVILLSAVIVLADIIALNIAGEVSSGWWPLAVPVGLLLVPAVGVVCLILLIGQRRDNPTS